MIRVVVADDQALLLTGLVGILGTADDLIVVGQAADGEEAVRVVTETRPDVVLMDIRMPFLDGLEATRRIVATTATKVVVLTTFDLDEYVFTALRHGASGFLLKDTPPADLLAAVRVVAAGEALLAPAVTRRLIDRFVGQVPARPAPAAVELPSEVTPREREVLGLVARGLTNQEIADALTIGLGTAKTHVARLLVKLAARDRVQLVIRAHGLDQPDGDSASPFR